MHTCILIVSIFLQAIHTVFHISAHLEKQYDSWLEYRSDEGAKVVV